MTNGYMRYPPAAQCYGVATVQFSEPIAAGANPIRWRNTFGNPITIIGLQAYATTLTATSCALDLQNAATASHLAAPLAMTAATRTSTATITGAAGATIANGVDAYFIFTPVGGGTATNVQATMTFTVLNLSL